MGDVSSTAPSPPAWPTRSLMVLASVAVGAGLLHAVPCLVVGGVGMALLSREARGPALVCGLLCLARAAQDPGGPGACLLAGGAVLAGLLVKLGRPGQAVTALTGVLLLSLGAYSWTDRAAHWLMGWPLPGEAAWPGGPRPFLEALGFLALGGGGVLLSWREGILRRGLGPHHLSAAVLLLGGGVSLLIWQVLSTSERVHLRATLRGTGEAVQDRLVAEVESRVLALARMARRWEVGASASEAVWRDDARWYLEHIPSLDLIARVDASREIEALVIQGDPGEPGEREGWLRSLLGAEPELTEASVRMRARVLLLPDSQPVLLTLFPVLEEGATLRGALVGILRLAPFLERVLRKPREGGFRFSGAAGPVSLGLDPEDPGGSLPAGEEIRFLLQGVPWRLRVRPSPEVMGRERTALPGLVLAFGGLLSALLGLASYLGQMARDRSREVGELLRDLRHEVDERHEAEVEVQARNRDLETLLFVVSHDLKEPLRAVASFSLMLEERYREELPEKARDLLDRIRRAALRQERLLDEITTLSRAQRMDAPREEVPLEQVLEAVCQGLQERLEESGARLRVESDLPCVPTDPTWAVQAVSNLVSNALKFTREGEAPEVEVRGYRGPEGVGVVVADRGPGVPEGQEERIFQLFKRAVGRDVEGTGAGLAIVKQIAERHGGRVWVEPREGGGSCFHLVLGSASGPRGEAPA